MKRVKELKDEEEAAEESIDKISDEIDSKSKYTVQ